MQIDFTVYGLTTVENSNKCFGDISLYRNPVMLILVLVLFLTHPVLVNITTKVSAFHVP